VNAIAFLDALRLANLRRKFRDSFRFLAGISGAGNSLNRRAPARAGIGSMPHPRRSETATAQRTSEGGMTNERRMNDEALSAHKQERSRAHSGTRSELKRCRAALWGVHIWYSDVLLRLDSEPELVIYCVTIPAKQELQKIVPQNFPENREFGRGP
jgi:hypothetical protein